MIVGITLGFLIGAITSAVFISLLKRMTEGEASKNYFKIIWRVFGMPTFWFGGPWAATKILRNVNWDEVIEYYAITLAITFFLICIVPLIFYVVRIKDALKRKE